MPQSFNFEKAFKDYVTKAAKWDHCGRCRQGFERLVITRESHCKAAAPKLNGFLPIFFPAASSALSFTCVWYCAIVTAGMGYILLIQLLNISYNVTEREARLALRDNAGRRLLGGLVIDTGQYNRGFLCNWGHFLSLGSPHQQRSAEDIVWHPFLCRWRWLTFLSRGTAPSTRTSSSTPFLCGRCMGCPSHRRHQRLSQAEMVLCVPSASNRMRKAVSHMHKPGEWEPAAFLHCGKLCAARQEEEHKVMKTWVFIRYELWHQWEPAVGFQTVRCFLQLKESLACTYMQCFSVVRRANF